MFLKEKLEIKGLRGRGRINRPVWLGNTCFKPEEIGSSREEALKSLNLLGDCVEEEIPCSIINKVKDTKLIKDGVEFISSM